MIPFANSITPPVKKYFILLLACCYFFFSCSPGKKENTTGIYVPDDLEATVFAETPMLHNPTNMDVDARGRIWVTEAVDYRNYNNDSTKFFHYSKGDRVVILEDTDGDGKADTSKVFAQDSLLVAPLGIAVIGNKVVVSCSPNLIIYTDENGDDVADKREVFLTGFGGKDHDHSLHATIAGPDGKWYFITGNAGPHIVTDKAGWTLRSGSLYTGGSPYNQKNQGNMVSDDGKVWVGGLALQMNPDGTGLKVLGNNFRNSYEVATDSYGNMWQNDNDDQVVTCRTSWLMEGGNAGYFSADGTRTWDADQRPGQDIFTAHWHQEDPGVMPAGDRTGAGAPTGIVMNESDALGTKYRGMLLSADAGRNTIFAYTPTLHQSGYDLGARTNFISSLKNDTSLYVWNDSAANSRHERWFRPSDVSIGTEGAIYVADWYDPVVGGHAMEDTLAIGKIYRIAPKGRKLVKPVYNFSSTAGQMEALKSPAINVRNQAFQLLQKQGDAVFNNVDSLIADANPFIQARAVWLLNALGTKGKAKVKELLNSKDEALRIVAFRACRQTDNNILPLCESMSKDKSSFVRREIAIALRDSSLDKKKNILLSLAQQFDGKDPWYLEALGAGMEHQATFWYNTLKTVFNQNNPTAWNTVMKDFAWRLHPANAVNDLVQLIKSNTLDSTDTKKMLTALAFVRSKEAAMAMIDFAKSPDKRLSTDAAYWASFRQGNEWASLVDWSKSGLNAAYERKLAVMKVKVQKMLDQGLSKDENGWNAEALATDSMGGQMLIGLMAENKIPQRILSIVEKNIFNNPSIVVRTQASKYFKKPGATVVYEPEKIVKLAADATAGKSVFTTKCATCHKVAGEGNMIGPDLSSIGKKYDKISLLDAIINPSASIVFGYEPWLVTTKNGETLFGFLIADGKQSITIKDVGGAKHVIAADKIVSKTKQQTSLMPEPSTLGIDAQNMANLVEFLRTVKQ